MNIIEFNRKYKDYLEEGSIGLTINNEELINYLDDLFQELITIPGFQYSEIKINSLGFSRFYCDGIDFNRILPIEKEINKFLNKK